MRRPTRRRPGTHPSSRCRTACSRASETTAGPTGRHGPGVRGPAAGGVLCQGRLQGHGFRTGSETKVAPSTPARATSSTSPAADLGRGGQGGPAGRHHRLRAPWPSVDSVNICVPTPLGKTRDPDISYIQAAVDAIAPRLHRGMLVILESTTYPGTTEEVILPMLLGGRPGGGRGLLPGLLARARRPGQPDLQHQEHPQGGRRRDAGLHRGGRAPSTAQVMDTVVPVSSVRVAETVKLLENTFRSVNIGLVNEIALMCDAMDIDVWEVIDAAATKPFGFMPFYPGPGLGGHCIPIDPFYLSWKAKQAGSEARFIELAGQVNGVHAPARGAAWWPRRSTSASAGQGQPDPGGRRGLQAGHRRHARIAGPGHHGDAGRPGRRRSTGTIPTSRASPHGVSGERLTGLDARGLRRVRCGGDRHAPSGRGPRAAAGGRPAWSSTRATP